MMIQDVWDPHCAAEAILEVVKDSAFSVSETREQEFLSPLRLMVPVLH